MDVLTEDPTFPSVLDQDFEFDNNALNDIDTFDLENLEKYISEDVCMPEEAISAIAYNHPHPNSNGFKINNLHLRGLGSHLGTQQTTVSQVQSSPPNSMYCNQQQQQQQQQRQTNMNTSLPYMDNHPILHTTLPDSPPDSEPYSPPDGHPHTNGQTNHHVHSSNHSLTNNHHNTHQENSKYTVTSTPSSMYHAHHRPPGMAQPKTLVTMPGYHEPPLLNHLPPTSLQPQLPPVTMPLNVPPQTGMNPQILTPGNLSPTSKKRKHMDSPNAGMMFSRNGLIPNIKQEPNAYTNSSYLPDCEDDSYSNYDPDSSNGYDNGVYQVIKWQKYEDNKWATLTDANLKDLPAPQFRVDADKGFNFSVSDDSFVCQKKNHFQITCHIGITGDPKYVRTHEGVKKIDHYCLHFNGIKLESPSQTIKIEQSQSDRSKKPFKPVRVDILPDNVSKMTVGRLHFSETTSNNMRKKGRPNPDQRYFQLVVALHAHSGENSYLIAGSVSAKIIVRVVFSIQASNPGQFDSDMEATHWTKGSTPDSVYHIGRVGVNTDHPDEAVTVHGNIKLSGQILHTSDIRAKQDFHEVDSKEQLKKVSGIKIYNYKYSEDYADHVGLPEDKRKDTGVIAQEVQEVLPDAVIDTGDVKFENGNEIKNLLVVNKDRIFMENVGAVKELCKLTDNLEVRIDELEKMNTKLSKLKRFDSLKSTVSSKSTNSNSTVNSSAPPKKPHKTHRAKITQPPPPTRPAQSSNWCSNRFIQITIIILICIMAFCLIAITILYILERQKDNSGSTYHTTNHIYPSGTNSSGNKGSSPLHIPTTRPTSTRFNTPEDNTTPVPGVPSVAAILQAACRGPPNCEEQCCGPQSDQGFDTSGYSQFLIDIEERILQATNAPYTIINSNGGQGQGNAPTTSASDKIQVVINPNSGQYIDSGIEKDSQNSVGPYYRRRRRRRNAMPDPNAAFLAQITIPELNFTLTEQYKDVEFSMQNNFTYNIMYSKYFDMRPYKLKFGVSENMNVHMCHHGVTRLCDTNLDAEIDLPDIAVEWQIPIGRYHTNFLQFRVTTQDNTHVCAQPGEESVGVYVQYNLLFARSCS
ncbi:myelin regulatory factor-like isoform X3 [Ruditapes philippinarum]|uniref:myelin regulatory factor-like isoform X3 n=1 Tax=Ruditapes philippinarum TaxID=129788 RepID=UPI00295ADD3A|nr:myelin regulatory factor-like isoform X3 [Ruditapes philippinarum]